MEISCSEVEQSLDVVETGKHGSSDLSKSLESCFFPRYVLVSYTF